MLPLALAALFWIVLHLGLAGSPARRLVVERIGARAYRGAFALLSALGIAALALAYGAAPHRPLWDLGAGGRWIALTAMLPALFLLVGSLTVANPTAVGGERLLARPEPAAGVLRITRHPMLWAFALWAGAHLVARGDTAGVLLFGAILVVALAGMASIDRKRAGAAPTRWARFAAVTSVVPFAAILAGRNRLDPGEIGWWRPLLALALWAAAIHLHPAAFGLPVLPW